MATTLDGIELHDGCSNVYCSRCQKANEFLTDALYTALGERNDWCGMYHGWLSAQGLTPETEGGWWSRDALTDANVQRFINQKRTDAAKTPSEEPK